MKTFDLQDKIIAAGLALGVFLFLSADLGAPGVTWDEAYPSFHDSKRQAAWIANLFSSASSFSQETIDLYWESTSDHPTIQRSIAAISYLLFSPFLDEIIAFRLPVAFQFSVLIASIFLFLRLFVPKNSSVAGALSLVFMPRVFGHAHLANLDTPIMCWWFWAAIIVFLVYHGRMRPIWFGLAFAIAFGAKLHAAFLPFPLLAWAAIQWFFNRDGKSEVGKRIISAVFWACILTPVLYIGLQPWLWHDAIPRIAHRFLGYAEKVPQRPIPLYYFGTIYAGNTPWHYPLVLFFFSLPPVVLLLWLIGLLPPLFAKTLWGRGDSRIAPTSRPVPASNWISLNGGIHLFLLFLFVTPLALLLLPMAQGYDGCRLFLPAFPFAALMVGFGFDAVLSLLRRRMNFIIANSLVFLLMLVPPLYSYYKIHPYYLAYYNELAGGIRGAKEMGMETTFYCDALKKDFIEVINAIIPADKSLKPCSMSFAVIQYYKDRGWLREDIHHDREPPWDFYLLQCRQGMFRETEWYLYKQQKPLAEIQVDGVPLFKLYGALK